MRRLSYLSFFFLLILLSGCSGRASISRPSDGTGAPLGSEATSTTAGQTNEDSLPSSHREPLDGKPDELGVASIDFITAMFPTSPGEYRVRAAWEASRYNIENAWVESCMSDAGFFVEIPRETAMTFRRGSELPDFELDARFGIYETLAELPEPPGPPASSSAAEAEAWQARFLQCSLDVEKKRSEGFDQVIGSIPNWFDIVREVNASASMTDATKVLLGCVADGGGPRTESITELYQGIDQLALDAGSKEEFNSVSFEMARLIADCAGDYAATRQALLIPERDELVDAYQSEIAEAELYFNEIFTALGQD